MSSTYNSVVSGSSARPYQICTKTIMDTSDPDIVFDENGVCNHYYNYFIEEKRFVLKGDAGANKLMETAEKIRIHGKGKKYDCIIGLSGGVDSTYLCLLAKQLKLRPLVVHFDNGWNSELAVNNIENTVRVLGFDLYTYVVNWPEFRDLQRSFFKANVVDIEVLTDHGFMALLYRQAYKNKIKYVLGGMNVVTESILPKSWIGEKGDIEHILSIQKQYGTIPANKLATFPQLSLIKKKYFERVLKLEIISPLNWIDYRYDHVKDIIKSELNWRDYGGKHYESIFTRFYQGYILPQKFGIDKRRAHLSTLICSGQLTRDEAVQLMMKEPYDRNLFAIDKEFVLKKLGFSESEFNDYLAAPRVEHSSFGMGKSMYEKWPFLKLIRPIANFVYPERIR